MIKQWKNGTYYVDYRDANGKRHRETLGTVRKIAEEMAQEILYKTRSLKKGLTTLTEKNEMTFRELWNLYSSQNPNDNRPSTVKRKTGVMDNYLLPLFGDRIITTLQEVDFLRYLETRKKEGASVGTRNKELCTLKAVFTYARRQKFLAISPVDEVTPRNEREFRRATVLSPQEEKTLLECASPHIRPIINFALATGMRRGEILGLTWDRVNMSKRTVFIPAALSKNKRARTVPLTGKAWGVIKAKHDLKQEVLTVTASGEVKTQMRPSALALPVFEADGKAKWSFRTAFEAACRRAGLTTLVFHDLRRTCATRLLEAGTDFRTVAEWIGDTPTVTAEVYCQTSPDRLRQAGEKMAEMFDQK